MDMHKGIMTMIAGLGLSASAGELLTLTNDFGSVAVEPRGARIVSYVPAGRGDLLVLLPGGSGGIALCWPWFQFNGPRGRESPKHGIARYRDFTVVRRNDGPRQSELELRLVSDAATRKLFPHDFALTVTIRLDERLTVTMTGENTGSTPFPVTEALHPYFRTSAPLACRVETDDGTFGDKGFIVEGRSVVFTFKSPDPPFRLVDPASGQTLLFTASGSPQSVVWNPGPEGHLRNPTIGPDDWKSFVCVENGTFETSHAYTLAPGERHTLVRTIAIGKRK